MASISLSQMEPYLAYLPKDVALRAAATALAVGALYIFSLVTYRLVFSPIAGFPGPKIAAATTWYELYYDVIHKGKYIFEIEKMHDKYGMYCFNAPVARPKKKGILANTM